MTEAARRARYGKALTHVLVSKFRFKHLRRDAAGGLRGNKARAIVWIERAGGRATEKH